MDTFNDFKYAVVGAGFFGSVIAERVAADMGEKVLVVEKRDHIGGNCYSYLDKDTGIECHKYGSHIFHTSNSEVWEYLNSFVTFTNYQHKVLTRFQNKVYQMPMNLSLINAFYGLDLNPQAARRFIAAEIAKENVGVPQNLEEKAISLIGRPLYEAFIKGYTIKQWEKDPRELPADIITRLPIRYSYNSNYFSDKWQGMPVNGYTDIFEKLLGHGNITVMLNTDYFTIKHLLPVNCMTVFTGPIDRYFKYKFGQLGWRSLRFEQQIMEIDDYQGTSVMNYADAVVPYTRIHEFRHLHEERSYSDKKTIVFKEYPENGKNATELYPINTAGDLDVLRQYKAEAKKLDNVIFGGRMGEYRYFNMDKTIEIALCIYKNQIKRRKNVN